MEELAINIKVAVITKAEYFAHADMCAVISGFAFITVFILAVTQSIGHFTFQHTCTQAAFRINAVAVFITCSNTAAVINKASVTTEKLIVKIVISAVVAAAVFVEHTPAKVTAVVFVFCANANNGAPAVNFNIAVYIIFAAVAMYGGKGFNAVFTVAA